MVNFDDVDNVENRPENGEMKSRLDCGNMSLTFSHARDAVVGKCPNTRGHLIAALLDADFFCSSHISPVLQTNYIFL